MAATSQKRANYRIEYPRSLRPTLTIDHVAHEVINLSEKGIKFARTDHYQPQVKDPILGTLTFANRESLAIVGRVLRLSGQFCVAVMRQGVPLPIILEQQRILLRKTAK